jgi:hypothetical protein
MTKQSGLGDNLYVGGFDLSGDIATLQSIAGGNEPLPITGIDKSGMERRGGKRDGLIDATTWFNPSAGQQHDVQSALPTTDVIVSYFRGTALGGASANLVAKQANYDATRGDDGSLTFNVQALANAFGLEWGTNLTPGKETDTSAANGSGVDFAASSSFGLQAYCHVFAFTGTSVTIKLQESADDAAGDPYADVVGGSFGALTAVGASRIATATNLTVERWLRVVTTGTFSNAVFAVSVVRNPATPVF